ncbi:nitrite reductase small subunit NirD [Paenibacillus allorhizosphaerae]|uniref:Assimilatory nitrite reductase [NAD(P)H] small subunit n=1 Tax=Paenibacillus allorhizosphaerae TaxID=2849866 RepID=A0ABN7THS7_9BACL|nr:nitrite reductase small subunit NirD [Paenibacillus allorhizosphaerae]CAG7628100.1 Assimilatory nitrite reductase [NAD(P)H] small subunit [Paenibacillus allorhizosphaerae]
MEIKVHMDSAPNWIAVALFDELPVQSGKTVRYHGLEIALFRFTSGKVHAVQNRCPHKNGVLAEGLVCDEHVYCPMHERKIHIPSGNVQKPDTGCVQTYETKIENGQVYIALPEEREVAV